MARPIRFLPPGVLYRCIRIAAHPIPDDPWIIDRLQARLVARKDRVALVRIEADRVETWFWADRDVSEISSFLNVVHSKLSRDINTRRGTRGTCNFPGTSEPQPFLDDLHAQVFLSYAAVSRVLDSPTRVVLLGPDMHRYELGRHDRASLRALERFVDMLAGFLVGGERRVLLDHLFEPHEAALAIPRATNAPESWNECLEELAEIYHCELLPRFVEAQDCIRQLYVRTGRDLACEFGPGICARGTHLHRPLRAACVTVEEPVVSVTPGNPDPPAFCAVCEGRAGGPIDWENGGEAADDAFIASQMRPRNGQLAGGGARLLGGTVAVRERPDPPPLAAFEAALEERRLIRQADARRVVHFVWREDLGCWDVGSRPRTRSDGWPPSFGPQRE